jgi:hypothetical protein
MTKELFDAIAAIEKKAGKDWMRIFKRLETAAELIAEAKIYGVEVSGEQAEEALALLRETPDGEISDEEMTGIAGGKIDL